MALTTKNYAWFVYLLRLADNSLYCGITTDVKRRLKEHQAGTASKCTRAKLPCTLEISAAFPDRSTAAKVEYAVKQKPAQKKKAYLHAQEKLFAQKQKKKTKTLLLQDLVPKNLPEKYNRKITAEEINNLPIFSYSGKIHKVDDEKKAKAAARHLAKEKIIGFDTETRPALRKGQYFSPSLVQLACAGHVYIVMLDKLPLPAGIIEIFENKNILKTGVAVNDDIKALQKLQPFKAACFLDLGTLARTLGLQTHGLRNLTAKFMHVRISKSARRTNWANPKLSKSQIRYAATDAWAGREIYLHMMRAGLAPDDLCTRAFAFGSR